MMVLFLIPKYIQKYGEIHLNNNSKIIIIINNTLKGTQINGNCYSLLKVITSQVALVVKNLPTNAGGIRDVGSIPGLGRSPGGGHGNLLQCSCLENHMDRGAWRAAIHRFTKSLTQLK